MAVSNLILVLLVLWNFCFECDYAFTRTRTAHGTGRSSTKSQGLPFRQLRAEMNDQPEKRNVEDATTTSRETSEKRIIFIRHGRTYMNDFINGIHYGTPGFTDVFPDTKEYRDKYHDSPLGPTGLSQVQELNEKLVRLAEGDKNAAQTLGLSPRDANILEELDLIVTSPLTRALQTLDLGVYPTLRSRKPLVLAVQEAAERIFMVSDLGKTREELRENYSYVDFDSAFSPELSEQDFWHYVPTKEEEENYVEWRPNGEGQVYACLGEPEHCFNERMEVFSKWLDSRPESTIAVVCHAGVILWFLGEIVDNCELRVVRHNELIPAKMTEVPKEEGAKLK